MGCTLAHCLSERTNQSIEAGPSAGDMEGVPYRTSIHLKDRVIGGALASDMDSLAMS